MAIGYSLQAVGSNSYFGSTKFDFYIHFVHANPNSLPLQWLLTPMTSLSPPFQWLLTPMTSLSSHFSGY
jgi:hypothetical protein